MTEEAGEQGSSSCWGKDSEIHLPQGFQVGAGLLGELLMNEDICEPAPTFIYAQKQKYLFR